MQYNACKKLYLHFKFVYYENHKRNTNPTDNQRLDARKQYEVNKVDYDAYKEWQKENPPKKRKDESDYNNYKAQYNATNQRCKSIAFKIYAGTKLIPSEEHFYKKNKTTIELLRLSLSKRV